MSVLLTALFVFGIGWFVWRGISQEVKRPGSPQKKYIVLGGLACPITAYLAALLFPDYPPPLGQVVFTIYVLAYAVGALIAVPKT